MANILNASELEIEGIGELKAKLELLRKVTAAQRGTCLKQGGHLMVGFCKVNCPVDTGRLRASIGNPTQDGVFDSYPDEVVFGTSVYYAGWVEDGTQPHVILPKNKKMLAWPTGAVATKIGFTETGISRKGQLYRTSKGELTGNKKKQAYIFAKKVNHPGYKGSHYMLNGVTQSIPAVVAFISNFYAGVVSV